MSFPRYPEYKDSGVEWLEEVPAHWEALRIKHLVANLEQGWSPQCEGFPVQSDDDWGVLKVGCVNGGTFRPEENKALPPELVPLPELGLASGDLLISRANTRELVGSAAVALRDYPRLMLCDKLYRLRLRPNTCSPLFLALYLSIPQIRGQIELSATGASSSMLNIGQSTILELDIAIPSLDEQAAIATFLDRETAKIDALVAEQEKLIALLQEKRQAVISHAVTKGLEPNVPMKDSRVEWLGEVPAHWEVKTLARVSLERCDGPFGSGLKSDHYTDSGALVIRLQNIRASGFFDGEPAYLDLHYFETDLHRHNVVTGDVLIAGLGDDNNLVGRACVAPKGIEPALVKADCFRFRLYEGLADPAFVAQQLCASALCDSGRLSSGSTRSRIPLSVMGTRKLALPPLREQINIAQFIEAEVSRFGRLESEARNAVALLQERRTALISAAVTGQIDVRGLAPTKNA